MSITHLDCTLRDGGYYNDWDFSYDLVQAYLRSMDSCGVDFIELGLRSATSSGYKGPYAFTTDSLINRFNLPERSKIGVMVNGVDFAGTEDGVSVARRLFAPASESPVALVRLACHFKELEAVGPVCQWLKERGYLVGLNLMQIAQRSASEREEVGRFATRAGVDALYFADSLGSLDSSDVVQIIQQFRQTWYGDIGIHAHDNMGRAVTNSLSALEHGACWVDSTVTGMGRGPGNAQTEYMAIELSERREREVDLVPLLELIDDYFRVMKQDYGWGENPYYYLSAKYDVHPTYIQKMLADRRFTVTDKLSVVDHLKNLDAQSFNAENLLAGRNLQSEDRDHRGTWSPASEFNNRELLILAAGPSLRVHADAIASYIAREKPIVIALNTHSVFDSLQVDYHVAAHPVRLMADSDRYRQLGKPLISPIGGMNQHAQNALTGVDILDFGMRVRHGVFTVEETGATLPAPFGMCYALAIASSSRCPRVLLAGIDGYGAGDPRNTEMNDVFEMFQSSQASVPLLAVTKSIYDVPAGTIHAM